MISVTSDKNQTNYVFKYCKRTCLNFAVKLNQSLYLKGTIISMIDKRTVHQMYLISHSVSESMHVLLTPRVKSWPHRNLWQNFHQLHRGQDFILCVVKNCPVTETLPRVHLLQTNQPGSGKVPQLYARNCQFFPLTC